MQCLVPAPVPEGLEWAVESELAGDPELEAFLRQLRPAPVSNGTERAVFAQMALRTLVEKNAADSVPDAGRVKVHDRSGDFGAGHSDPSGRGPRSLWGFWSALAATAAVVMATLYSFEKPQGNRFLAEAEPMGTVSREPTQNGNPGTNPSPSLWSRWSARLGFEPGPGAQQTATAGSGGRSPEGTARRGDAAVGAVRAEEGVVSSTQSARPKGESAGNGGAGAVSGVRAVTGEAADDASEFIPEQLEAKRLASFSQNTTTRDGGGIASSVRTLLPPPVGNTGAAGTGVEGQAYGESLVDSLAAGKVTEILPKSVLAWIGETSRLAANSATGKPEVAPITRSTDVMVSSLASGNPGANSPALGAALPGDGLTIPAQAEVPRLGGESTVATAEGRVLNPALKNVPVGVTILPVDGLTTAAQAEVPRLGGESTVVTTGGRVLDSTLNRGMSISGGDAVRPETGELLVFEGTDGAVRFRLIQSGAAMVGRFFDGGGNLISEGVVRAASDVTRIAQQTRAALREAAADAAQTGD